ncbi:MAG: peptidase M48, partial [Granulicella sp.]
MRSVSMRSLSHLSVAAGFMILGVTAFGQQTTPASSDPAQTTPAQTTSQTKSSPQVTPKDPQPTTVPLPPTPPTEEEMKAARDVASKKSDSLPSPGESLDPHIKAGSEDDVAAVGTRNIGGRGMGNWYST